MELTLRYILGDRPQPCCNTPVLVVTARSHTYYIAKEST
jgi:hypothetical protein